MSTSAAIAKEIRDHTNEHKRSAVKEREPIAPAVAQMEYEQAAGLQVEILPEHQQTSEMAMHLNTPARGSLQPLDDPI